MGCVDFIKWQGPSTIYSRYTVVIYNTVFNTIRDKESYNFVQIVNSQNDSPYLAIYFELFEENIPRVIETAS